MKRYTKYFLPTLILLFAVILYAIRWTVFADPSYRNEMLRFLIGDLAFLAVQVLFVTIVLETFLKKHEHEAMREKLNMIVGSFFSQTGFHLLRLIIELDETSGELSPKITPAANWTAKDYAKARAEFENYRPSIHPTPRRLEYLKDHLGSSKDSILTLLANQALLEHEKFTDLLWSITHLAEELSARNEFVHLPAADIGHLVVDIKRAYALLGDEWLEYLYHLQTHYPYLFSMAIRNNPLDPGCCVEVQESSDAGLTSYNENSL